MARNLPAVFKLRDQLFHATSSCAGLVVQGEVVTDLVDALAKILTGRVPRAVVFLSCQYLLGHELQSVALFNLCWRLAGNLATLRNGQPVLPWVHQPWPEWVPVYTLAHTPAQTRKGQPAAQYQLRVLAGSSCPRVLTKVWPLSFVYHILALELGFTKRGGKRPLLHPREVVELRFEALIEPAYCVPEGPGFDKLRCNSSARSWNRSLLKPLEESLVQEWPAAASDGVGQETLPPDPDLPAVCG
jgi:hypothetical protein